MLRALTTRWKQYNFLFSELVKRDFKKKYKRTVLGILWSLIGPLLQLSVMALVFIHFFGNTTEHFIIYLFAGNLVFAFFRESTTGGMGSLMSNSGILTKIRVPKYLFLLAKNVQVLINFGLTMVIFFIFVAAQGIAFHPRFLLLIYPAVTLLVFNIGVGLILSALFVFFKDTQYLYDIFLMLVMWLSAIFYPIDQFSYATQRLFLLNPVFTYIHYFRVVVLHGQVPSLMLHGLTAGYALTVLLIGAWIYKRYNYRFAFYM